jgi:hypothetical protein
MKKETLYSTARAIFPFEKSQSEFLKGLNDLPVLRIGDTLKIREIDNSNSNPNPSMFEFDRMDAMFPNPNPNPNPNSNTNPNPVPDANFKTALSFIPGKEYELKFDLNFTHGNPKVSD